jgi:hypothetical protein
MNPATATPPPTLEGLLARPERAAAAIRAAGLTLRRGVGYLDHRGRCGCLLGCLAAALRPDLDRPGLCAAEIRAALAPAPGLAHGLIDGFDGRPAPGRDAAAPAGYRRGHAAALAVAAAWGGPIGDESDDD